jgi:ferrous iron transport protein B
MSQIYVGAEGAGVEEPSTLGEDVIEIASRFGSAVLNAAKSLLSIVPGIELRDGEEVTEDTALSAAVRERFTPLTAVALVAFILLYVPCVATLGAIRQEYGGRWALFSAAYQLALAWGVAFIIFQGGRLLGLT